MTQPRHTASHRLRSCRPRQGGSVYALVLGVAMLITVIGMGALATARVASRSVGVSNDWAEAGAIAYSAVEHAIAKLNAAADAAPTAWRSAYTDGAVAFSSDFGRGKLKWVLVDGQGFLPDGTRSPADDRVIHDDYADDLTVYGIGQIGSTTRVFSVRLTAGGAGMDVLGCAVHASGSVTLGAAVYMSGGPLSTAGSISGSTSLVRGGGGSQTGSAKAMPSAGVFDTYKNMATVIASSVAGTGSLSPSTLSAADNPYGDENPNGIYYLQLPSTVSQLTIQPARYKATLVIEGAPGLTSQIVNVSGGLLWEPHAAQYPTLITKNIRRVRVDGSIDPFSYGGDSLPSELRGLIHLIASEDGLQLQDAAYIRGCVIVDGPFVVPAGTTACGIQLDPTLLASPPVGYTKGTKLLPTPGSWQWAPVPPGVN